jgi:hypothetical protein
MATEKHSIVNQTKYSINKHMNFKGIPPITRSQEKSEKYKKWYDIP